MFIFRGPPYVNPQGGVGMLKPFLPDYAFIHAPGLAESKNKTSTLRPR